MSTWQKPWSKQAYRVIHQPVFVVLQFRWRLAGETSWLAEISADLPEVVAHLRRDATMRYTNTPLRYFVTLPNFNEMADYICSSQ